MKKLKYILLVCGVLFCFEGFITPLWAQDFTGRESEMNQKCRYIQESDIATQNECKAYATWSAEKRGEIDNSISSLNDQIGYINGDLTKLDKVMKENLAIVHTFDVKIAGYQADIAALNNSIAELNTQISTRSNDIALRDEEMQKRLLELQPYIGSNNFIDFLMGANSFTDLIRRSEILGELNTYDADQIKTLNNEKKELLVNEETLKTQESLLNTSKQQEENARAQVQVVVDQNSQLADTYRAQVVNLEMEKRQAQMAQADIPAIDTSIIPDTPPDDGGGGGGGGSSSFLTPISGNWWYSAGTWTYSDGSPHFGMDFATSRGSAVRAPATGLIIYSYQGCDANGGYLGNWCGVPSGGGNNNVLLSSVDGVVYAMPFDHMSSVSGRGAWVNQGDVIGYSGNSGNSTGPHLHTEIIRVGRMSIQEAADIFNRNRDVTFGAGWGSANPCSGDRDRCRIRPENYYL